MSSKIATLLAALALCVAPWRTVLAQERCDPWVARIVSIQGQVEFTRTGPARWQKVSLNETLCAGDSVRIEARSRAAIVLANQTILRLDEGSAITFTPAKPEEDVSLLEMLKGVIYFISRVPRSLTIETPFVNAAIEGTEFMVRVEPDETGIWVFEGQVRASNDKGSLNLATGEAGVAKRGAAPVRRVIVRPRDAVQWALYYPPVVDLRAASYGAGPEALALRSAVSFYQRGDLEAAFTTLESVPEEQRSAPYHSLQASLLLSIGRVEEAESDIDQALRLDPNNATAYALQSVIALAQNDNERANTFAQKAIELDPNSAVAHIAGSYAEQASFDIERAKERARKATELAPTDALAWSRLSELQLSFGDLDSALDSAREAASRNPRLARTQTVLGFAYLTRIDIDRARAAFAEAIRLDQADPLPRLGLGLAKIRDGKLAEGRREIEIAASLNPDNALVRSYLGKAYFEEKRDELAGVELQIAKELDPNDPTPWFYDAIMKQTQNRPIEALRDLQRSVELNENRAVYRSRLLLDEDNAVRGSSLARIYDDLGFSRLAQLEAAKSLGLNPGDHSAHRFLSDSYIGTPRMEVARVSELLQAQLLQPLSILPVHPSLLETDLNVFSGIGPASAGFNEFTSLFMRDRARLTVSGFGGNNDTLGDEVTLSGILGRFSYSLGQFHYESDGYRDNNDVEHDIYDVFGQVQLATNLDAQFEYRRRETDQGDRRLNFDPDVFSNVDRRTLEQDSFRVGVRLKPRQDTDVVFSGIYSKRKGEVASEFPTFRIVQRADIKGYDFQGQYLFRGNLFNFVAGGGVYRFRQDARTEFTGVALPTRESDPKIKQENFYSYANIAYPDNVVWTLGVSNDAFDDEIMDVTETNPKFGLQWKIANGIRLKGAALKTLKRQLTNDQTLEPTQVAGFNQFFDDTNGAKAKLYGIGLDATFTSELYGGVEVYRREVDEPFQRPAAVEFQNRKEDLIRAYVYATPHKNWAFSAEYQYEETKSKFPSTILTLPTKVRTTSVPIAAKYFNSYGMFAGITATYVQQKIAPAAASAFDSDDDAFVVTDVAVGYRLPKRRGVVGLEVQNLFNKDFLFQDLHFTSADPFNFNSRYAPDRTLLARVTLVF